MRDETKDVVQEISAKLVKQLRDKTDAGIMECKNALKECSGNIDKAIEYLRQKGLNKAAKKADRIAAEGVIAMKVSDDFTRATLVEVNSETDFVAKNEAFQELVTNVVNIGFDHNLSDTKQLMELHINNTTFEEYLKQKIATIGENIVIRRIITITCTPNQIINGYLHHNKKIGAIVVLESKDSNNRNKLQELVKYLSMQVASMKPKVISYKELDSEFVTKERVAIIAELEKENEELARLGKPLHRIPEYVSRLELNDSVLKNTEEELKEKLKKEGKPEKIWDKILPGQLERFIQDNTILDQRLTLLGQFYTLDDKKSVEQVINAKAKELKDTINIVSFKNFELGEGIEKKADDFATEVAAQMK
ncbi:elongation factor Ts [Helicobacter didelphidarum]|uniref:Elongation factor Ts n=1 Tax=Helicobacter didelphidarum TaxID=2040648 RepID=A0A3D8INI1_9HELI|nr:translation elongation factor Ts [Helicobacter didelphidarum]RDU66495.1 elongation factor Ts [Helicobacter didelphidarum]